MIVIAWCSTGLQFVSHGARDIGQPDKFKTVIVGNAAMWANNPLPDDLDKAYAYAERNGYTVLVYDDGETEPLKRARAEIVTHSNARIQDSIYLQIA